MEFINIGEAAKRMSKATEAEVAGLPPKEQIGFFMATLLMAMEELRVRIGEAELITGLHIAIDDLKRKQQQNKDMH